MFDPTFGVFFGTKANINSLPLSSDQLRFLDPHIINKHVFMATKSSTRIGEKLSNLYSQSFSGKYMTVDNYLKAEQAGPVEKNLMIPLMLRMDLSAGKAIAGVLDAKEKQNGQSGFLQWTNTMLGSSNSGDHTSYLFNFVGNYHPYFHALNVIKLIGMKPNNVYDITFYGFSDQESSIQIVGIGNDIRLNKIESEVVKTVKMTIFRKFRALSDQGHLIFHMNSPDNSVVHLFGINITESKNENNL